MIEAANFARLAGTLLRCGLQRDEKSMDEAARAYNELAQSPEGRRAAAALMEELGLVPIQNVGRTRVYLTPTDPSSVFAMKNDDVRKAVSSGAKAACLAFGYLSVIGTFYPNRSMLNANHRNGITEEDVYDTSARMVELAAVEKESYGPGTASTMAETWSRMPVRDNNTGLKGAFQEFYVKACLNSLIDQKMVTKQASDGRYYPTDRLREVTIHRLDERSGLAAELLSAYHDSKEMD
jgi:hypothetical protein